jgi:hypothetical protein
MKMSTDKALTILSNQIISKPSTAVNSPSSPSPSVAALGSHKIIRLILQL